MNRLPARLLALSLAIVAALSVGCLKPKPKKPFGETCASNIDCESLNCNEERGGFCSKACHSDADCAGGDYVCAGEPTGTSASCAKKVGNATGSKCKDRSECDHGSCLRRGDDDDGFCSARCKTSADCPAGFKVCDKIGDMGAQKLCLPGAEGAATPKVGVKKGPAAPAKPPAVSPPPATSKR